MNLTTLKNKIIAQQALLTTATTQNNIKKMDIKKFKDRANELLEPKKQKLVLTPHLERAFNLFIEGIEKNKGIAYLGNTGAGKTFFFKVMNDILPVEHRFYKYNSKYLEEIVEKKGDLFLREYIRPKYKQDFTLTHSYISDVGYERQTKHVVDGFTQSPHYIESVEVFVNEFHEKFEANLGHRLYFCSNLTREGLEKRYGSRFYSRVCEMVLFVGVGKDEYSDFRKM